MPYAFGCPECGSKLKTAAPIPADRSIQCPKCKHTFTGKDTDIEEVPTGSLATASKNSTTSTTSRPTREEEAPRRRPSEDEPARSTNRRNDDDDLPRTRRRDDGDDDRRSRRRDDDDDDRRSRRREDDVPRSRRRDDDDDDRRSRRRDDDDDDRPRRRRLEEEDDYDPRSRRGRKKGNKGAMMAIIALVLLVIGGVTALLIWGFGGSSNYDKEMLAYLPKNTVGVFGMDIESLMKFESSKEALREPPVRQALDELKQKVGLTVDDFQRVVVGMTEFGPNKEPDAVVVVRFKSGIEKDKIVKELNAQKKEKNGSTYYISDKADRACFYFPTDELMVFATKEGVMTDSVLKSDGTIQYSEELQEMAKPISKYQVWGAVLIGADLRKEMVVPQQAKQQVAANLPKVAAVIDFLPSAKGFSFYVHDDGSNSKFGLGMKVGDSTEAGKFSEAAKEAVTTSVDQLMGFAGAQIPDDVKEFVKTTAKNTKADRIGDVGYVVINMDDKDGRKLMEKYKNQLNNMGGGGGFGAGGFGPGGPAPAPKFQPPVKGRPKGFK